jgi:transposase
MSNRRLELKDHLSSEELKDRYRSCRDGKEVRRWHILWLVSRGYTLQQAADIVGLGVIWVRKVIHRYNKDGPESITDGHNTNPGGGRFRLNGKQQEMLFNVLKEAPPDGGAWTGPKVAAWIEQMTGVKTYPQLGWVYLRRMNLWLGKSRLKKTESATAEEEVKYKKTTKRQRHKNFIYEKHCER